MMRPGTDLARVYLCREPVDFRKGMQSLAVLVGGQDALDQYFMNHPEELFERPPEAAVINPANPEGASYDFCTISDPGADCDGAGFPVMLVPELLLLMVLWGATEGFQISVVAIVVGLGSLRLWRNSPGGPVTQGTARVLAALLVVVGIGLLVAGIRDV